jgi:hypothetical protein
MMDLGGERPKVVDLAKVEVLVGHILAKRFKIPKVKGI